MQVVEYFICSLYFLLSSECHLLGSVLSQQKFGVMDIKALGMSQLLDRLCYSSRVSNRLILDRSVLQLRVTVQFYLENSRKIHPLGVRACRSKDVKRRESPGPLAPLFICFFLPPGPALCKLG